MTNSDDKLNTVPTGEFYDRTQPFMLQVSANFLERTKTLPGVDVDALSKSLQSGDTYASTHIARSSSNKRGSSEIT